METVSIKPKSFWSKPEGTTGALVIGAIVVVGGYLLWSFLPALIILLQNAVYATILGIILFALIFMILDKRLRTIIWYFYKSIMRTITGLIIQLDPIKILETYIQSLQESMEKMNEHITTLAQEVTKLRNAVNKNKKDMENNLSYASEAKKHNNGKEAALSARQAERLRESNVRLIDLLAKLESVYNMLKRVYENAGYLLQDTENEVDIKKREYVSLKAGHSAFKAAMKVIKGDPDELEIFNMSMEAVSNDISNKIGEMERFMELSASAMTKVDIQNAVFEEQGFQLLEQWEKDSSILNDSGSSASSKSTSKYSSMF
jgi:phage shock protein A